METNQVDTPACPSACVHIVIYLLVNLIRFFVISLISCPSEQSILVVWILELFGINVCLFAPSCLCFTVDAL